MHLQTLSLRALQVYAVFSAAIAVLGGGTFVLYGADGAARVVGVEYPALVPMLGEAAAGMDA